MKTEWKVGKGGYVKYISHYNNEQDIVNITRGTTGVKSQYPEEDRRLFRKLVREVHTSPLEFAEITFQMRCPIFVFRQLVRHRTFNVSEYSGRYQEMPTDFEKISIEDWRVQSKDRRQGSQSGAFIDPETSELLSTDQEQLHEILIKSYKERIQAGVAKEQARSDLPLSTMTEVYWKADLHNLLHMISLRDDYQLAGNKIGHAQLETRKFVEPIAEVVAYLYPNIWEAFSDFHPRREALSLSRLDLMAIQGILKELSSSVSVKDLNQLIEDQVRSVPGFEPQKEAEVRDWRKSERLVALEKIRYLFLIE